MLTSSAAREEGEQAPQPVPPAPPTPPDPADGPDSAAPPNPPTGWKRHVRERGSSALRDPRFNALIAIVSAIAAIAALQPVISDWLAAGADVQVVDYGTGQNTSPNLVVPRSATELNRPPDESDRAAFAAWADENDAVYADNMSVGFTANSGQVEPTIITAVRVEVVQREEPMQGTWIAPDGAGPQGERVILADLDADPPTASLDGTFAFPLRVNNSDTELFSVRARATTCHCYWQIEVDIIGEDGKTRTLTVDNDGEPFELTGTGNTRDRTYLPANADAPWPSND